MKPSTHKTILDPEYGANGIAYPDALIESIASSVRVQNDQRICVGAAADGQYVLFRVDAQGTLDQTFGEKNGLTLGRFKTGFRAGGRGVQLLPDGSILMSAYHHEEEESFPALARFSSNGKLDKSFGDEGHIVLEQPPKQTASNTAAVAPGNVGPHLPKPHHTQQDFHPILVVSEKIYVTYKFLFSESVIFRFNSDGSKDSSFNQSGYKYLSSPSGGNTYAEAVLLDKEGILLCGSTFDGSTRQPCVIRLLENGDYDTHFGSGGFAYADLYNAEFSSIAKLSSEKIVCAGYTLNAPQAGILAAFYGGGKPVKDFNSSPIDFGGSGGAWRSANVLKGSAIITAGNSFNEASGLVVGRFLLDGQPDTQFSEEGWVSIDMGDGLPLFLESVLLEDGKCLISGRLIKPEGHQGFMLRCLTTP